MKIYEGVWLGNGNYAVVIVDIKDKDLVAFFRADDYVFQAAPHLYYCPDRDRLEAVLEKRKSEELLESKNKEG